jgi:3-oxoacyl-(acyl-carrier-protein) synthase
MSQDSTLVIVGVSKIDAETENVYAQKNKTQTWIQSVPLEWIDLADVAIKKLPDSIKSHVNTIVICSATDDSHARFRTITAEKSRPRDVMGALGVSLPVLLNKHFVNVSDIFKVDAACASGLYALNIANNHKNINNGVFVIAGVDKSTSPYFLNLFRQIGAVSENTDIASIPFDQRRSGFVMGEGAAMLAVTTANYAMIHSLDIVATVDAIDTKTILTHPTSPSDPVKLKSFIEQVISSSQQNTKNIAWWDAHATATPVGDEIEFNMFLEIFKDTDTVISSYKGRVGHCMSASSIIELANAIMCTQQKHASGTYGLTSQNAISSDTRLITNSVPITTKTFIKTSFGFGGRNGVAIITVC